jgi:hypothetical protein
MQMATVFTPFDTYSIYYTARGQDSPTAAAVVNCYMQGTWVGQVQFLPTSLPFNTGGGLGSNDLLILYFASEQFQDILAIIRGEEPLALWFDLDAQYGYLVTTDQEPVGELEGQAQQLVAR